MKSIITIFTAFFLMFAMVSEADAKRFGGGGFGKSHKTSPFASQKAAPAPKGQQQASQKKGGMMGGLMGGLLAGGIFAALLGSGAFEDIQIMDMIIMAALAFLAFKLFKGFMGSGARSRQQPAAAGLGAKPSQRSSVEMPRDANADTTTVQEAPATQATEFNQDEVPFNLPEGFDQQGFIEGSLNHYRTVQESWNKGELETVEEYVSPELFTALSEQRNKLVDPPQTEVLDLTAEIVRADQAGDSAEISILFRGVCKDVLENSQDGIYDIWHLQRDLSTENADWVIVGIEAE